ncbi:hypothetical protein PsorP6_001024 [Peronosclerospora sorghi]|uniref:Uncharacterized protein n=1 Tax=Peronosclerospora sorghi TaxID=230839 RepID=A0ACC0WWL0_9STRA|nr:hypothetical protein PsorP6_001024 [Peronosclerospora sorghi]
MPSRNIMILGLVVDELISLFGLRLVFLDNRNRKCLDIWIVRKFFNNLALKLLSNALDSGDCVDQVLLDLIGVQAEISWNMRDSGLRKLELDWSVLLGLNFPHLLASIAEYVLPGFNLSHYNSFHQAQLGVLLDSKAPTSALFPKRYYPKVSRYKWRGVLSEEKARPWV